MKAFLPLFLLFSLSACGQGDGPVGGGSGGLRGLAVSFDPIVHYPVGDRPRSVAVGDLNHDGAPDLVVANSASGFVSVLMGMGDGSFNPAVSHGTGLSPNSVDLADFNLDGNLDFVAAHPGGDLSIFLGNGSGDFAPAAGVPMAAYEVKTGDFNNDGSPDVAGSGWATDELQVALGDGAGNFGPVSSFPTAMSGAYLIDSGDMNNDGNMDIVLIGTFNGPISIFLGNGGGSFQESFVEFTPRHISDFKIADLNLDGLLDLAAGSDFAELYIYLGNGAGGAGGFMTLSDAGDAYGVGVGDLNGDGFPDIAHGGRSFLRVYEGDGTGNFPFPEYLGGSLYYPLGIKIEDLDRDGDMDIVEASFFSTAVGVRLNTIPPPVTTTSTTSTSTSTTSTTIIGGVTRPTIFRPPRPDRPTIVRPPRPVLR